MLYTLWIIHWNCVIITCNPHCAFVEQSIVMRAVARVLHALLIIILLLSLSLLVPCSLVISGACNAWRKVLVVFWLGNRWSGAFGAHLSPNTQTLFITTTMTKTTTTTTTLETYHTRFWTLGHYNYSAITPFNPTCVMLLTDLSLRIHVTLPALLIGHLSWESKNVMPSEPEIVL